VPRESAPIVVIEQTSFVKNRIVFLSFYLGWLWFCTCRALDFTDLFNKSLLDATYRCIFWHVVRPAIEYTFTRWEPRFRCRIKPLVEIFDKICPLTRYPLFDRLIDNFCGLWRDGWRSGFTAAYALSSEGCGSRPQQLP
jgi:hypothetical protein